MLYKVTLEITFLDADKHTQTSTYYDIEAANTDEAQYIAFIKEAGKGLGDNIKIHMHAEPQ